MNAPTTRDTRARALVLFSLIATAAACGDDGHAAPPPPPNPDARVGAGPSSTQTDAGGGGDAGADADASLGGLPAGCIALSGDLHNTATVTDLNGDPLEPLFVPTRAYAKYNPTPCDGARELVVGLSVDECGLGRGHRLTFTMDADQIGTGIAPGPQSIAFADFIRIRYLEPPTAEGSSRLFTNCTEAGGTLTMSDLGTSSGARLAATFDMTLAECIDPPTYPNIHVVGAFDVTLEEAFDDVCTL